MPIPVVPYVVLHTYVEKPRQLHDEVVIHAMCAELWLGGKPIAQRLMPHPPSLVTPLGHWQPAATPEAPAPSNEA